MGKEELRQYPRLDQEFPVKYEVVPVDLSRPLGQPKGKAWVKNVSGGGMYLLISHFSQGMIKKLQQQSVKLSLVFCLPDFQNKIKVLAEVRWSKKKSPWWTFWSSKWAMGVRYTAIQPEDRDCIIKYVINKQIEDHLMKHAV